MCVNMNALGEEEYLGSCIREWCEGRGGGHSISGLNGNGFVEAL